MEIKKINGLYGFALEKFSTNPTWYFQNTEISDFYDLNMMKITGDLKGSEIVFISYPEEKVIKPFEKEMGVYYNKPLYLEGKIYFIRVDFNDDKVEVLGLDPKSEKVEEIFSSSLKDVDLYNLGLSKYPLMLLSQDDSELKVYYPESIIIKKDPTESFLYKLYDKYYFSSWGESGVLQNGILGSDYEYFEDLVIKDKDGNILSKERGSIEEVEDGIFWIY